MDSLTGYSSAEMNVSGRRFPDLWLALLGFELHKKGLVQCILIYLAFSFCHIVYETHPQGLHVTIICSSV